MVLSKVSVTASIAQTVLVYDMASHVCQQSCCHIMCIIYIMRIVCVHQHVQVPTAAFAELSDLTSATSIGQAVGSVVCVQ